MATDAAALAIETAKSAGLTYVNDHDPGIRRVIGPDGANYMDAEGRPVRDEETLERIRKLSIPPAWTSVWICPDSRGHIQAVGRDARGRKQYRYHADWRASRDELKFHRMQAFGAALPKLRARVEADLVRPGLPREKVLAATVRLLEITLIRVGNDEYVKANRSFGLTTLRKRHVTLSGTGAVFEFRGKAGKVHRTGFRDRRLARVLRRCQELPGQRLFQYVDEAGERRSVESDDVNAYLREALGGDFTAKDFRTWAATLSAARALCMAASEDERPAKKTVATCVKAVAGLLGNTAAVCKTSYIHPQVFEAYLAGSLPDDLAAETESAERALLRLLGEKTRVELASLETAAARAPQDGGLDCKEVRHGEVWTQGLRLEPRTA
jgi:DNA topoisomerase-1